MLEKHVSILGIPFVQATRAQVVRQLYEHIKVNEKAFVVTANPEIVMKANEDTNYGKIVQQADYITADGIGVVKAAQLLHTPLPERVTGYELMMDLLQLADENQLRVYLLGAEDSTLQQAVANITSTYPRLQLVGSHHGFFDWNSSHIQEEIVKKQPDLVFVALGVPKQEEWIAAHIDSFHTGIFMGVGGSFDVIAGTVKRAPIAWQRANLEWLYRIIKQPSRLKRSLALPKFALQILKQKARESS